VVEGRAVADVELAADPTLDESGVAPFSISFSINYNNLQILTGLQEEERGKWRSGVPAPPLFGELGKTGTAVRSCPSPKSVKPARLPARRSVYFLTNRAIMKVLVPVVARSFSLARSAVLSRPTLNFSFASPVAPAAAFIVRLRSKSIL